MGSLARQWTLSNFDRLVKRVQWSPALDHLVALGVFEPASEDYQDIRAGGTDIKSARLLIEKVLERSENAVEKFRNFVLKNHSGLEWKDESVCEERLTDDRVDLRATNSASQRHVRKRSATSTNVQTGEQKVGGKLTGGGHATHPPTSFLVGGARAMSKRRRKKADRIRARTCNAIILAGVVVLAVVIASFWPQLQQAISTSAQTGIGQPPLRRGVSPSPVRVPKEVIDFRSNALATLIHTRAHDRTFLWLTEEDPQPVENVHVNLVITTKAAQLREEEDRKRGRKTPAIKVPDQDPMHGKIPVDVADMFNPAIDNSTTDISTIILRAEAGMGKTFTFAKTMPLRWLKNSSFWPELDLVFVVHLGNPQVQVVYKLEDVFFEQFGESVSPAEKKVIMSFIWKNPQRVLLVCDAFDEGENFIPLIIEKLIKRTLLPGLRVLVTSRPCIGIRKLAKFAHRQLELLGIAKEDLPEFIQKQLRREQHADRLTKGQTRQLKDRKDMVNLMGSPLIASLVCGFFAQEQYLPGSSTELYQKIIINLLRRANEKTFKGLLSIEDDYALNPHILKLSGKAEALLDQLGKLALFGLRNGKVVFKKEEVYQFCNRAILEIGILMRLTKTGSALTPRDFVAFFHLTFMEFFAGYALSKKCTSFFQNSWNLFQLNFPRARCVSTNLKEFPIERERNMIVWFFASGLSSLLGKNALYYSDNAACREIRATARLDRNKRDALDWVIILSTVQLFSEMYVDARRAGIVSPVYCPTQAPFNILSSMNQVVQDYPVLKTLISASSWEDDYVWMPVMSLFVYLATALIIGSIFVLTFI